MSEQMTRDDAALAAGRAALAAGQPDITCLPFSIGEAASFVERHPDAPAEALYIHTNGGRVPWAAAGAEIRVCCEVYRATFLALLRLVPVAPPAPRQKPRGRLAERAFDERAPGLGDVQILRRRALRSTPLKAAKKVSAPAAPPASSREQKSRPKRKGGRR